MNESYQKFRGSVAFKLIFLWLTLIFIGGLYLRFSSRGGENSKGPQVVHMAERLIVVANHSDNLTPETRAQLREVALQVEQEESLKALIKGELVDSVVIEDLSPTYKLMAQQIMEEQPERTERLKELAREGERRFSITAGLLSLIAVLCLGTFFLPKKETGEPVSVPIDPAGAIALFLLWDVTGFFGGGILVGLLRQVLDPFLMVFVLQSIVYGLMLFLLMKAKLPLGELFKPFKWSWIGKGYLLSLGAVFSINIALTKILGESPQSENPVLELFLDAAAWKFGLLGLLVVFVGPVFEELMFRGWIIGGLREKWGDRAAIVFSAALFALIHGDLPGMPALFALGLVFGWVYRRSGSLWASILVHGMWNATTFSLLISVMP